MTNESVEGNMQYQRLAKLVTLFNLAIIGFGGGYVVMTIFLNWRQ